MIRKARLNDYEFQCVWTSISPEQKREVIDFWAANGAIDKPEEMERRSGQVCWTARNPSGELVALCTIFTADYGTPLKPHYVFRSFTRSEDRHSHLAFALVGLARKTLAERRKPGDPQQGLIIVAQNEVLVTEAARQVFQKYGWTHKGVSPQGFDIWRLGMDELDLDFKEIEIVE